MTKLSLEYIYIYILCEIRRICLFFFNEKEECTKVIYYKKTINILGFFLLKTPFFTKFHYQTILLVVSIR
jgi:hypothetical protein